MIGKLLKGRGMRGLLDYLFAEKGQKGQTRPRVKLIGGTFAGTTPLQIAREFAVLRSLRPKLEVAVVHETLRLPPSAAEPTDDQWRQIAQYWADKMGFQAWVAVAHGDGHIHIAASRILIDGSVVSDFQDWTISERIVRELEIKFGLDIIEASHLLGPGRDWIQQKAPSQGQLAVTAKTQLALPSEIVAATIDGLLSKKLSATDFIRGLEAAGIDVRPNIASTDKVSGFSYCIGGVLVTAKSLGRSYTWANLQRAGLQFDPDRDLPALRAALETSAHHATDRLRIEAERAKPAEDNSTPSLKPAEAYGVKAAANFIEAAGSDQFVVDRRSWRTDGPAFGDFNALLRPDTLRQLLEGRTASSPVKAEIIDTRIVTVTDLSMSQVDRLGDIGLEPFAVTEFEPGVFEACIRLLPASEPAPSGRVQRKAAAMVAERVGSVTSGSFFVPGFASAKLHPTRKRRSIIRLRRAARVVARLGAELVQGARKQLEELKRGIQTALKIEPARKDANAELSPTKETGTLEQLLKLARQRPTAEVPWALEMVGTSPLAAEEAIDSVLAGPD